MVNTHFVTGIVDPLRGRLLQGSKLFHAYHPWLHSWSLTQSHIHRRGFSSTPSGPKQPKKRQSIDSPHVREQPTGYDLFQRIKSPPESVKSTMKRKPSQRVQELADKILSLSLIEAADLCELCQETLQSRHRKFLPVRTPFPHPEGYFAGAVTHGIMPPMGMAAGMPVGMPAGMPMGMPMMAGATAMASPSVSTSPADVSQPEAEAKPPEPKEKERVNVKLTSFDLAKKVPVVKEVRAALGMGLAEAKETVEAAPKILQRNVPREDALKLQKRLEDVGAEVVLE